MAVTAAAPAAQVSKRVSAKSKKQLREQEEEGAVVSRGADMVRLTERQEKELVKRLSTGGRRGSRTLNLVSGSSELQHINPFQTNETMEAGEMARFVAGCVLLLPLRLVAVTLVLATTSVFMVLSVVGQDISRPLPEAVQQFQLFLGTSSSRLMCAICGIYDIKVKGRKCEPSEAKMFVVAPHSTAMDALVVGAVVGAAGVAKGELEQTPLVGAAMRAGQTLFVQREGKASRKAVADAIKERISRKSPWTRALLLFPEGTCTNRTSLISFRRGAFEPGAPVQPVVLSWQYETFDPAWTAGAMNRTRIVLRTLTQWKQEVTVTFLPVVEPSAAEQADAALFTNNVRDLMAKELGVPTTEFSYNDMFLAKAAAKAKLQPAFVLPFTFVSLEEEARQISAAITKEQLFEDTKTLLGRFGKAPGMRSEGRMSDKMFAAVEEKLHADMHVPDNHTHVTWPVLLRDGRSDGTVSFHTVLLALLRAKYGA